MNPIDLNKQSIPPGYLLVEGKHLQATARTAKIAFAPVTRKAMLPSGQLSNASVGIAIHECDHAAMQVALARRNHNKAKDIKFKCRQKS